MDIRNWIWILIVITGLTWASPLAGHAAAAAQDQTLSPYFWVQSDDPAVDQLPLKSTDVRVSISGVIADVAVTQVYENEGRRPLEAIYVFPASTKAAVYGMKMTIGERTITAQIKKRDQARRDYENAKNTGQSASLLEQQRPNVFQMNVANILPGDVVTVELAYTELLVPVDAVYGFVYPTVVGPRYVDGKEGGGQPDLWAANPYLRQGEPPKNTFNINVDLAAGLAIADIACATHDVDILFQGKTRADIRLDPSENTGGNRDFILKYRLAGRRIQSGLLLSRGVDENFFLMMLQPPRRVKPEQIPPREYVFIVDVSGSMHGFPLDISKKLLKHLIGNLRPSDRFNVLLFAGSARVLAPRSLPATADNIKKAVDVIENQRGGGGTRLLPALNKALDMAENKDISRTIVIATDGYVTVEKEAFDIIRNRLGDANMFAFGIGSSVNRHLIEGMARAGMGEPFIITRPEEAREKADRFRRLIESPVLTNIQLDFGDFDVYAVHPPAIPDVLADRPVVVFGKWRGRPEGTIRLSGTAGDGPYTSRIRVGEYRPDPANRALGLLWARHRIATLADDNKLAPSDERIQEVTDLGLSYSLLTPYTSFVAVDTRIRTKDGKPVTVKQPLPLPLGVSDNAVGGAMRSKAAAPTAFTANGAVLGEGGSADAGRFQKEQEEAKNALRIEHLQVPRGMSANGVRRVLERNLPPMASCLKRLAMYASGSANRLTITLTLGKDGSVEKWAFTKAPVKNRELNQCLTDIFENTAFLVPPGGDQWNVSFTLAFK